MKQRAFAYMAGIMDGEGHITITHSHPSANAKRRYVLKDGTVKYCPHVSKSWQYMLSIGVANTDKRLMNWIVSQFGGNFYSSDHGKDNWKRSYRWRLTGHKSIECFLLGIIPYLILKRDQACLALDFIRMNGIEDQAAREWFRQRFLQLNRRGVSPETNTLSTSEGVKIESVLMGNHESVITVM